MKKIVTMAAILIAIAIGVVCIKNQSAADNSPARPILRIGVINPVTGPLSEYGKKMQNAMIMAAEEINASQEHIWGVELIFEDAKALPKDTVMAFQRLKRENVDALIVTGDLSAATIQAMIDDFGKPTLAVASAHDIPLQSKWMFRCSLPVTLGSDVLAKYAATLSTDSIGVLYIKCQTGEDAARAFKERCVENGMKIALTESFDMSASDTRAQITKILSEKPSLVYVFGFGPGYVSALNNLKEQLFEGQILTHYEVTSEQDNIVEHGDGIIYSDIEFGKGSDNTASQRYCEVYREKYGVDSDVLSAFTYEAVRLLNMAAETHMSSEAQQLRESLLEIKDYSAVTGRMAFDDNGEILLKMLIRKKLKNGSEVIAR